MFFNRSYRGASQRPLSGNSRGPKTGRFGSHVVCRGLDPRDFPRHGRSPANSSHLSLATYDPEPVVRDSAWPKTTRLARGHSNRLRRPHDPILPPHESGLQRPSPAPADSYVPNLVAKTRSSQTQIPASLEKARTPQYRTGIAKVAGRRQAPDAEAKQIVCTATYGRT